MCVCVCECHYVCVHVHMLCVCVCVAVCIAVNILYMHFRFGYIDFRSHEDATEALNSNVLIHGRQIVLDMAESLRPPELKGRSVY